MNGQTVSDATKREDRRPIKRRWLAWSVSIGETVLLLVFGFVLSRYWLMLPVWMRRTAGTFLAIAFLLVFYRLFRFSRKQSRTPSNGESSVVK
jgi:uncharacterized membrane protein